MKITKKWLKENNANKEMYKFIPNNGIIERKDLVKQFYKNEEYYWCLWILYKTNKKQSIWTWCTISKTNKTWSIHLTEAEGSIENSSAVLLHILRFGYLLEPSDLNGITPTLDIDLDDPEYKELKNMPRS